MDNSLNPVLGSTLVAWWDPLNITSGKAGSQDARLYVEKKIARPEGRQRNSNRQTHTATQILIVKTDRKTQRKAYKESTTYMKTLIKQINLMPLIISWLNEIEH